MLREPALIDHASAHTCFCQARLGALSISQACHWLLAAYFLYVAVTASSYIAFFASLLTAGVAARDSLKELSFFVDLARLWLLAHFPALGRASGSKSLAQVFLWFLTAYSFYVAATAATASFHVAAVLWIVAAVTAALVALDSHPATPDVSSGRMLLFALYLIYSAATASSYFFSAAWFLVAFLVAYFTLLDFEDRPPLKAIFLWMLAAYFVFAAVSASSYIVANIWHAAASFAIFGALKHDSDDIPVDSREEFRTAREDFQIATTLLYYLTGHFVYFFYACATASSWGTAVALFCLAVVCLIPIAFFALEFDERLRSFYSNLPLSDFVKSLKDGDVNRFGELLASQRSAFLSLKDRYVPHAPRLLARVSKYVLAALRYPIPLIRRLASGYAS